VGIVTRRPSRFLTEESRTEDTEVTEVFGSVQANADTRLDTRGRTTSRTNAF
jgi:hypothetical protein